MPQPSARDTVEIGPALSSALNASRWGAAFLVLIGHVRHLTLVDYGAIVRPGLFDRFLYFFTGLGHEAVIVFFVISGLLVGGTTLESWRASGPDLRSYCVARFARIYTVLVPALIAGLCWDLWGSLHFDAAGLYSDPGRFRTGSLVPVTEQQLGLGAFIGNLLMLEGIACAPLGSNSPLWSLAYEWWYYGLCAAGLIAALGRSWSRPLAALVVAVLLAWLPFKLLLWGLIWALGIGAHVWIRSGRWLPPPWVGGSVFLGGLVVSRVSQSVTLGSAPTALAAEFARDFALGLTYVVALAAVSGAAGTLPGARWHAKLADFSYTTYLCHFPALLFAVAVAHQLLGMQITAQPTTTSIGTAVVLTAAIGAYCFGFARLTERYTPLVRRALAGRGAASTGRRP